MQHIKYTDSQLEYTAQDCYEAVRAFPESEKAVHYLLLARACNEELARRERLRSRRKHLTYGVDPLTVPIRYRRNLRPLWRPDRMFRDSARVVLAYDRLHST